MASIYELAQKGSLTKVDLNGKSEDEINKLDEKTLVTPLGIAVWMGHVDTVKILLDKGADVNGTGDARPPLWVAAAKAYHRRTEIAQLLLNRKANPNKPNPLSGTTPLLEAVIAGEHPRLISLLVDHGADTDEAQIRADDDNRPEILQALLPRSKRTLNKIKATGIVVTAVLGIIYWANKSLLFTAAVGAVGIGAYVTKDAIKRRFDLTGVWAPHISETQDWPETQDQTGTQIQLKAQNKRAAEVFQKDALKFIKANHLDRFFQKGSSFLEKVIDNAVRLDRDPDNTLNPRHLTRLALYQPVIYCDDSGSMKSDNRIEAQAAVVQRMAGILTKVVPDGEGIYLRFINASATSKMDQPSGDQIETIVKEVSYSYSTNIGTNLRSKILEPLVYEPLRNDALRRPLLICITTDGEPQPENVDTLKSFVLECGTTLKQYEYKPTVVRFMISQIGTDSAATNFLSSLNNDPDLDEVLYQTAERLDKQYKTLRDNDAKLEAWLLQELIGPIMGANENH